MEKDIKLRVNYCPCLISFCSLHWSRHSRDQTIDHVFSRKDWRNLHHSTSVRRQCLICAVHDRTAKLFFSQGRAGWKFAPWSRFRCITKQKDFKKSLISMGSFKLLIGLEGESSCKTCFFSDHILVIRRATTSIDATASIKPINPPRPQRPSWPAWATVNHNQTLSAHRISTGHDLSTKTDD